jgi:nitrite reductase/ring-hydroxylating ferredoxin subunit
LAAVGTGFGEWTPVAAEADLPVGKAIRVTVREQDVFLCRTDERIFALDNRCTHMAGPLHRGVVNAHAPQPTVTCPVHGSTFWLQDGRVVRGPATRWQPVYEARVVDGTVEIRSPSSTG